MTTKKEIIKIRPTKEIFYEKIYNIYKTKDIAKPLVVIEELKNTDKDDISILTVLKSIRYGLHNLSEKSVVNKQLVRKYSRIIKAMEEEEIINTNNNKWASIQKNVSYYIIYKKHMKNYKRNKAIVVMCTCMHAPSVSDIINMIYLPNSDEIGKYDNNTSIFIKSIKKFYINKKWFDVNDKVFDALDDYCTDDMIGNKIFDINLSRVCKIVFDISKQPLTIVRNEYYEFISKNEE
jgi:hypothetical protein